MRAMPDKPIAHEATLDLASPKDAHIDQRLRSDLIIWLTTVRPDGRPHTIPVWFLWDGSTVLVFSRPGQKLRNLRHSPNVTIALDNSQNGRDVVLFDGVAEMLDKSSVNTTLPEYVEKYGHLIQRNGWTPESMSRTYDQPILITPTRFYFR